MPIVVEFPTLIGSATRRVGFYSRCYYGVESCEIAIGWGKLFSSVSIIRI